MQEHIDQPCTSGDDNHTAALWACHLLVPGGGHRRSITSRVSLLLYGPPGTGKTALAQHNCPTLGRPLVTAMAPCALVLGARTTPFWEFCGRPLLFLIQPQTRASRGLRCTRVHTR